MSKTFIFDTEVYVNCTLFCAQEIDTGERVHVWLDDMLAVSFLREFVEQPGHEFIGFNSAYYDDVIVNAWISGCSSERIKSLSNQLIDERVAPWKLGGKLSYRSFSSLDLRGAAPAFVGLKALGARMHMPTLQDLPIAHDAEVSEEQRALLLDYCWNDVLTTLELTRRLNDQLVLRVDMSRKYGVDLRSKSDAQLAERTLAITLKLRSGSQIEPPAYVRYTPPNFLRFKTAQLSELLERVSDTNFTVSGTGHVSMPEYLTTPIQFGTGSYKLGVGGVHSTHDKSVCHIARSDVIVDIDAASFYPSIIVQCGFIPAGLGQPFIDEFRSIYERRLEAKRVGDKNTDASLKVAINSVFGQFGNRYSVLYAPDLMVAVTLTGQFTLLMLIEWLEHAGAVTLSANTDGIAMRYPSELEPLVQKVVARFSQVSGFDFEFTPYRAVAFKDVNNYFAVKLDRKVKARGIYAPLSLKKNPTAGVCAYAVGEWLAKGVPFMETIKNAPFTDFISARNVTGGGAQAGVYLGKTVRWYQSADRALEPLRYVKNNNKVPKTDGARACMVLPDDLNHPTDLDYNWYYAEALKIATACGCSEYLTEAEREMIAVKPKRAKKKDTS
jgi:hypothetical protein